MASIAHISTNKEESRRLLYRIIPEATYKRRKETLTPEESGLVVRLARVVATASFVWNSQNDARYFLRKPHLELAGQTPLDVSFSEVGACRVEEVLWRLFYGIAA